MRTAVFPGSFDPFTIGHKDIADRALRMFDRLIIAIGYNEHKPGFIPVAKRLEAIRELYASDSRVEVTEYTGLTIDLCRRKDAAFIVRGVRNVTDFEYERNLADINRTISGVDTVVIVADPALSLVSSSMVRELVHNGFDASRFLPFSIDLTDSKK